MTVGLGYTSPLPREGLGGSGSEPSRGLSNLSLPEEGYTLSGRAALLEALAGGAPVPPPAAPIYLSLYLEPHRRRLLADVYAEMAEGETSLRLTFEEEIEAQVEAMARAMALFEDPPAWFPVGLGPSRAAVHGAKVTFPPGRCLWQSPHGGEAVDYLAPFDNRHGDVWELQGDLPDPQEVQSKIDAPRWEDLLADGADQLPRRLITRLGHIYVPCALCGSPFWHCYTRLGFSGMMRGLREAPEVIDACNAANLPGLLAHARAMWEVGVRCMFVEECFSSADLISTHDYQRFALGPTRDLLQGLRDIGFQVVYYYCGALEGRLEHLASLPVNALAFEESKKGFTIDLGGIRQEIGPDPLLFGNVDVVLIRDGSEEAIAAEVARQYEVAGPRYVVSMGSPATLDTPPHKLDMLVRAANRLGPR